MNMQNRNQKTFQRNIVRWAIVALCLLGGLGNLAYANAYNGHPEKKPANWIKELDLDAKQVRLIEEHRSTEKKYLKNIHQSIKERQKELRIELAKPNSNPARIDTLMSEISALKELALKSRVKSIQTMKKILKPEQHHYLKEHLLIKKKPKHRRPIK